MKFGLGGVVGALVFVTAASAQAPAAHRLTGMWAIEANDFNRQIKPPFTPAEAAAAEAARKASDAGAVLSDAGKKCLPIGMPGFMTNEFALQIIESPGRVTLINEASPIVRNVYLGRKDHGEDFTPGWNGHSIGSWDGDVLVIDTVGLNDRKSHIPRGRLASDKTRIVEKIRLTDGGQKLVNEMTFYDPVSLTEPFTLSYTFRRLPEDSELWEYACEVNAVGWSERFANDPAAGLAPASKPAPAN